MSKKDRGFNELKGATIVKIDTSVVNCVTLFDADGQHYFVLDVELSLGVPVISCIKYHIPPHFALPSTRLKVKKTAAAKSPHWPFPTGPDALSTAPKTTAPKTPKKRKKA